MVTPAGLWFGVGELEMHSAPAGHAIISASSRQWLIDNLQRMPAGPQWPPDKSIELPCGATVGAVPPTTAARPLAPAQADSGIQAK
jgi:hypothetical protein